MAKQEVVVVGLGRFGSGLARTLSELGYQVLGLDRDSEKVEEVSEFATQTAQVDTTDEHALRELGVGDFGVGVVAIGTDLKSSILTTLLLKRLGVKVVISKAQDDLHGEILARVGADRVVFPERETGVRVAHGLANPDLVDYLEVTPGYGVVKLVVPPNLAARELGQLELKARFGLTVLVLGRGEEIFLNPSRSEVVKLGDVLVVAGRDEQLEALRTR